MSDERMKPTPQEIEEALNHAEGIVGIAVGWGHSSRVLAAECRRQAQVIEKMREALVETHYVNPDYPGECDCGRSLDCKYLAMLSSPPVGVPGGEGGVSEEKK